MIKIAPEGWPFIVGAVLLTLAVYLFFRNWSVAVPVVLVLFMLFFFRDPERVISGDKDIFVSPADGKVIVIKDVFEDRYLKADARQISIFMSPFNVHVNRSPVDGTVTDVIHTRGDFKAAYKDSASASNENTVMILDSSYGKIVVRQVAGFIARRIVCRIKPGDKLVTGQRYGIIKFSSRVDIFLPKGVKTAVSLGDSVKAGETIIARIKQ
jgi:phosphatidylserine decarboxylase